MMFANNQGYSPPLELKKPEAIFMCKVFTVLLTKMPAFSHDASCIMSVQEKSAQIMPENTIAMSESVEKRIALPISCGCLDAFPP